MAALGFLTALTGWVGIALAVLMLGLGLAAAWDRALLRGRHSPRALEILPSGEGVLRLAGGEAGALRALPGSAVTRYWVALGADLPFRKSVFVVPGMLGEEDFRRLRLWALWGRVPGVAPGQLHG